MILDHLWDLGPFVVQHGDHVAQRAEVVEHTHTHTVTR
jgi:hypothetical protein